MSLVGKRGFFLKDVPFLLGRYPERPAPTHVINALLHATFGHGDRADALRETLRGEAVPAELLAVIPGLRHKPAELAGFRRAMRVVFDADGKVFPSIGSPFPLHPAFVSRDPSDDGFGAAALRLMSAYGGNVRDTLDGIWQLDQGRDALAEMATVLSGGAPRVTMRAWDRDGDTDPPFKGEIGLRFGRSLAELALRPLCAPLHETRSMKVAATMRGMFAAVLLATIRAPELRRRSVRAWDEVSPMFVYGGVPPGNPRSPDVRLAARAYEAVVRAHRDGLEHLLCARVRRRRIDVPRSQYARVLLAAGFDIDARTREEAAGLLGQSTSAENIASRITGAVYPPGHLERGFRSMGSKIGLAGPDRGGGAPRFVLETPVLAALVDVSLAEDRALQFEDWVDRLYEQFGFIVGRGAANDFEPILTQLDARGVVARALDANHEALRRRMLRAGLAVEYSDTETEVRRANS
jgi:hypothetical protein